MVVVVVMNRQVFNAPTKCSCNLWLVNFNFKSLEDISSESRAGLFCEVGVAQKSQFNLHFDLLPNKSKLLADEIQLELKKKSAERATNRITRAT